MESLKYRSTLCLLLYSGERCRPIWASCIGHFTVSKHHETHIAKCIWCNTMYVLNLQMYKCDFYRQVLSILDGSEEERRISIRRLWVRISLILYIFHLWFSPAPSSSQCNRSYANKVGHDIHPNNTLQWKQRCYLTNMVAIKTLHVSF